MLVTCEEMQRIEREAFGRGVDAAELMEEAGLGLAELVREFFPRPGVCVAFCGKGNNAGDALVAVRHLADWGWRIALDLAFAPEEFAPLPQRHYAALSGRLSPPPRRTDAPIVLLDGLLGVGARGEPRGAIADSIQRLNALRQDLAACTVAIDLPSGLDGDTGQPASLCVEADITATIARGKRGLIADEALNHVGRLALIRLPALESGGSGDPAELSTPGTLFPWLPRRKFDTHKGMCGRVGIIAGSHGLTGAARLASAAAVRAGAGLVTLYAKPDVQPLLAMACIPEVMVKEVRHYHEILDEPMNVFAVGPGLGTAQGAEALALIREARQPMIVDADALNAVSADPSILRHCRGPRLLTPHPGEMQRLFPQEDRDRRKWLEDFLAAYPVHLLLKGSRTILGAADGRRFYNTTGNPGMASGGMGDVLSGVCAALVMQTGAEPAEALFLSGVLGAWICGRAAEIAASEPLGSPEYLAAEDVIGHLGAAFRSLRAGF